MKCWFLLADVSQKPASSIRVQLISHFNNVQKQTNTPIIALNPL